MRFLAVLILIFTALTADGQVNDPVGTQYTVPHQAVAQEFDFARAIRDVQGVDVASGIPNANWKDWHTDYPDMDANLTKLLKRVTGVNIGPEVVIPVDNEFIMQYPLLYFVEPESVALNEQEVQNLREYIQRGGMIFMDDFHGDVEMQLARVWIQRVLPQAEFCQLYPNDELFHTFFDIDRLEHVANVGLANRDEPWENGPSGKEPQVWAVDGPYGHEVLMAFNMDLGDSLENALNPEYPQKMVTAGMKLLTNVIVYSLTH